MFNKFGKFEMSSGKQDGNKPKITPPGGKSPEDFDWGKVSKLFSAGAR